MQRAGGVVNTLAGTEEKSERASEGDSRVKPSCADHFTKDLISAGVMKPEALLSSGAFLIVIGICREWLDPRRKDYLYGKLDPRGGIVRTCRFTRAQIVALRIHNRNRKV